MNGKTNPNEGQACRSAYGPLKIGFHPVSSGQFFVYVEYPGRGDIYSDTIKIARADVEAHVVEWAHRYLSKSGDQTEYKADWKCSSTRI